jgi:hypothetical protein
MKKFLYATFAVVMLFISVQNAQAQAWDKSTKVLSLGLGGSNFAHVYTGDYYSYYRTYHSFNSPITGQLNFQGEFGVHDYVGIGFTTGIGGGAGYTFGGYYYYSYRNSGELTVPVGVIANFHFYQLIADKTGKDIHSDKLDVYAGADLGSGIAAQFDGNGTHVIPIAFGGIHVGARYYFTDKFGVNLELGTPYSKGFVNGGIVFKL